MASAIAIAVIAILLGLAQLAPSQVAAAPVVQEALPRTVTVYGPTAVTTGTTYSSAPLTVQGQDFAYSAKFDAVDVFVATDAGSTGTVTVTVQASPDEALWTNTTLIVPTSNTTGTLFNNTYIYRTALAGASATGLIRAPLPGEYFRVRVDVVGAVTPTVKATFK